MLVTQIWWLWLCWPLTSACWVHSNVYGLGAIHCMRYQTAVDPFHSTSSALHTYYHLTSVSEEIWLTSWTRNPTSIGEIPVPYGIPHFRRLATISVVSYADQGIATFTNLLQGHTTVVLACCTIEWEPDLTSTWEGRDTNYITSMCWKLFPYLKQQSISMCWEQMLWRSEASGHLL